MSDEDRILQMLASGPKSIDTIREALGRTNNISIPCNVKLILHELMYKDKVVMMSDPRDGIYIYALATPN